MFYYPPEQKPTDQKTAYVKRLIALPGDTIETQNGWAVVNGDRLNLPPTIQQQWNVYLTDPRMRLSPSHLRPLGIRKVQDPSDSGRRIVNATRDAVDRLESLSFVRRVELIETPKPKGRSLFPRGRNFTPDEYGPLPVPRKNETIKLTDETWTLYRTVIRKHEGHDARRAESGAFYIDGHERQWYTFEQDYYFVLGDNRDNSLDSRFWGYVPKDHLAGEAVATLFSWDDRENFFRLGRTFHVLE